MKSKWKIAVGSLAGLVALNYAPLAYGSMFGEENATLVQILAESFKMADELHELNDGMEVTANAISDVRDTYAKVNAGIEEFRNYSFDGFVHDIKEDFYKTYPGFEHFEYASEGLSRWGDTRTSSPWTAYEAITAVVGDLSAPLREDVQAGRANVDGEMLQLGEAGQSFSMANVAMESTRNFDLHVTTLQGMVDRANMTQDGLSPGQAAQVTAQSSVIIAAQNSYIIRLLSRGIQLDGVDRAIQYGERIKARNAGYDDKNDARPFAEQASKPAPLLDWSQLE